MSPLVEPSLARDADPLNDSPLVAEVRRAIQLRKPIARDLSSDDEIAPTLGQRLADRIARFGGSWTFILAFLGFLCFWAFLNSQILGPIHAEFDPYPYIFLNLFLSMLAALQAPVIMMSQNRQSMRDRLTASHDYQVNLKAELEIRELHDKFDALREREWARLVELQQEQIAMLTTLLQRGVDRAERG